MTAVHAPQLIGSGAFTWQQPVIGIDDGGGVGFPDKGDRYIVDGNPLAGPFAGPNANKIAWYDGTSWAFINPKGGMFVWITSVDQLWRYDGTSWSEFAGGGAGLEHFEELTATGQAILEPISDEVDAVIRAKAGKTTVIGRDGAAVVIGPLDGDLEADCVPRNTSKINLGLTDKRWKSFFADEATIGLLRGEDGILAGRSAGWRLIATAAGDAFMDFDVVPTANQNVRFRFFRDTNTTASSAMQVMKGDGSADVNCSFAGQGVNSHVNAFSGDFGVGTSSPAAKMDVRGKVHLHHAAIDVESEALRIGRTDAIALRYHSLQGRHAASAANNYLAALIHSASSTTSQVEVWRARGDGRLVVPGSMSLAALDGLIFGTSGLLSALNAADARTFLNVADGANAYVHPNHSGDVTSAGDGATAIGAKKVTLGMIADFSAAKKLLGSTQAGAAAAEVGVGSGLDIVSGNLVSTVTGGATLTASDTVAQSHDTDAYSTEYTLTIPANTLGANGDTLRVITQGITQDGAASGTYGFQLKIGTLEVGRVELSRAGERWWICEWTITRRAANNSYIVSARLMETASPSGTGSVTTNVQFNTHASVNWAASTSLLIQIRTATSGAGSELTLQSAIAEAIKA